MVDMVTRLGADYIQGYFYSKPVKKDMIPEVIERLNEGGAR
jgi:hypothetical protein